MKNLNLIIQIVKFVIYCCLVGLTAIAFIAYANNRETVVTDSYYLQLWTLFILLDMWYHGIDKKANNKDA
jgi:hypothetical protein